MNTSNNSMHNQPAFEQDSIEALSLLIDFRDIYTAKFRSTTIDVYVRRVKDEKAELAVTEYGYLLDEREYVPVYRCEDGGMMSSIAFHRRNATLEFLRSYARLVMDAWPKGEDPLEGELYHEPKIVNEISESFLSYPN